MNTLYKELIANDAKDFEKGLPAIYPLIYYHGDQHRYPYSLNFVNCFFDPTNIMTDVLTADIPLVNINEYSDDQILETHF